MQTKALTWVCHLKPSVIYVLLTKFTPQAGFIVFLSSGPALQDFVAEFILHNGVPQLLTSDFCLPSN
jgi:hypothetical protein